MSLYAAYRAAALLSRSLPLKMAYWLGLRIADCFYLANHAGRAAVQSNLRTIYTYRNVTLADAALNGLTRKCFQYFGKYLVDFFRYSRLTLADVRRIISIENESFLQECVKLRRGAVLVTAHFGNWELGGATIAAMGHRVHAMVLPQSRARVNQLFQSQREQRGFHVLLLGPGAVRQSVALLKQGELVAVVGDRDFTGHCRPVTFFGKPAHVPRGPAWLSKTANAPVLVGFLIRQVDDTFLLRIYPPIFPEEEPSEDTLRQRICAIMEKEISERPYQWFMFSNFWDSYQRGGHERS